MVCTYISQFSCIFAISWGGEKKVDFEFNRAGSYLGTSNQVQVGVKLSGLRIEIGVIVVSYRWLSCDFRRSRLYLIYE